MFLLFLLQFLNLLELFFKEIMTEKSGRMVQSQKFRCSSIIIWNGMEDARLHNQCPSNFCVGITLPHRMVVRGKIMTIEKVL